MSRFIFLLTITASFVVIQGSGSLNVGDVVVLSNSESEVKESFNSISYDWSEKMRGMLGKKLKVVAVLENGIIALPSPDGSQNGRWYFMKSVVHKPAVNSYKKEEKKHCYYDKYGNYETLEDATAACDLDTNCGKIYDESCDDAIFHLCPKVSVVLESEISCLYLKQNRTSYGGRLLKPEVGNCPDGYEYQQGDANGVQYAIRGPSGLLYSPFSSIKDCARICDGIDDCKAIEWSPSRQKCVLINTAKSNGPTYLDYEFCKRVGPKRNDSGNDPSRDIAKPSLLNCIQENSRCLERKQGRIIGPSCNRMYSDCVANATKSNENKGIIP